MKNKKDGQTEIENMRVKRNLTFILGNLVMSHIWHLRAVRGNTKLGSRACEGYDKNQCVMHTKTLNIVEYDYRNK